MVEGVMCVWRVCMVSVEGMTCECGGCTCVSMEGVHV